MATGEGGEGTFSGYSQVCPREAERERKTGRGHCWWLRRCAWRLPAAVPAQPGARSPEPALALGRGGGWPGSPAPGTEARAWGLGRRRSLSWSPRPLHYTAFVSLCCFCFCFFFFAHLFRERVDALDPRLCAPHPGPRGEKRGDGVGGECWEGPAPGTEAAAWCPGPLSPAGSAVPPRPSPGPARGAQGLSPRSPALRHHEKGMNGRGPRAPSQQCYRAPPTSVPRPGAGQRSPADAPWPHLYITPSWFPTARTLTYLRKNLL